MRHEGNAPTPHTTSVTGNVWSVKLQYGVGNSFCSVSSSNLENMSRVVGAKLLKVRTLVLTIR